MSLEEAIRQRKFERESQKLNLNLIYTFLWINNQHKKYFSQYDITQQQYNVLRILRGSHPEPLSTSMIRDRMIDKMSDVSRIVDRLIKKKLVKSTPCKYDKRLVDVNITSAGLSLLKKMDATIPELENYYLKLTSEEQKLMNQLLDKIREHEE